jgi:hypothetical protein
MVSLIALLYLLINKEILFPLKPFSGKGTALPICLILKVSSA